MTGRRRSRWNGSPSRGAFTLIELVVCMVVGVIISGIAGAILWDASAQRGAIAARSELVDVAAATMEQVIRYCREIPQDECPANPTPCLLGHAQISVAAIGDLRFGVFGFRLNGSNLEMTIDTGANWYVLTRDVTSLQFAYFSRTNASLASLPLSQSDREDVRRILVTLELARGGETAKVRSSIFLRNFMNEVMSDP